MLLDSTLGLQMLLLRCGENGSYRGGNSAWKGITVEPVQCLCGMCNFINGVFLMKVLDLENVTVLR